MDIFRKFMLKFFKVEAFVVKAVFGFSETVQSVATQISEALDKTLMECNQVTLKNW